MTKSIPPWRKPDQQPSSPLDDTDPVRVWAVVLGEVFRLVPEVFRARAVQAALESPEPAWQDPWEDGISTLVSVMIRMLQLTHDKKGLTPQEIADKKARDLAEEYRLEKHEEYRRDVYAGLTEETLRAFLVDPVLQTITGIDFDGSHAKLCELLGQPAIKNICVWPTEIRDDHVFYPKNSDAESGLRWTFGDFDGDWKIDLKGRLVVLGYGAGRGLQSASMTLEQIKQHVDFVRDATKPMSAIFIDPLALSVIEIEFDGTADMACRILGGTKEQLRLRSACFDPGDVLVWSLEDIANGLEGAVAGALNDYLVDGDWPQGQLTSRVASYGNGDVLVYISRDPTSQDDIVYWGDWDGAESWDMPIAGRVLIIALSAGEASSPRMTVEQARGRAVFHGSPGMVSFSMANAVMLVGDGVSDEVRAKVREHNAKSEVQALKKQMNPDQTEH
jgi:hypothetical protein